MDKRRREYLNELRLNISRAEKCQERDSEALQNLRGTKFSDKRNEIEASIARREKEIALWREQEKRTELGESDSRLQEESQAATQEYKSKTDAAKKKKKELPGKGTLVPEQKQVREEYRPNFEKDSAYFYRHFLKVIDSVPDYMTQKLANMPGNKGYIWRGVWLMGDLPSERGQPIVMFERTRDGAQRIHEIYANETVVYEKRGNDKKQFVSSTPRNPVHISEGRSHG